MQPIEDNGAAMLAWTLDLQEWKVKSACDQLGFVLVEDLNVSACSRSSCSSNFRAAFLTT